MRRSSIFWGLLVLALFASLPVASAESPDWNPLGPQDVVVIPIEHTPTLGLNALDCLHKPVRKEYKSDADFKAAYDRFWKRSVPTWTSYLTKDMVGVRKSAADWGTFMNKTINDFYKAATYRQTTWRIRMLADGATEDGWWPAPHSLASYCAFWKAGKDNFADANGPVRDAIEGILAQAAVKDPSLLSYHRVILLQNLSAHGGVTTRPPGRSYTLDLPSGSITKNFTVSYVNEEADDHAATYTHSHELGHQLGLPDFYYWRDTCANAYYDSPNRDCGGQWDVMAVNALTQFNAHARIMMGWLPGHAGSAVWGKIYETPDVFTDPSYWSRSYGLHTLEDDGTFNVARALRIPFEPWKPGHFAGYLLECRRKIGGDEIPAEGVVVRYVNEGLASLPQKGFTLRAVDYNNPNVPLSKPGQGFTVNMSSKGKPRYLSVRFSGFTGPNCAVTVTKDEAPPAPVLKIVAYARAGIAPIDIPDLQSADIWIDSQRNGWGRYASDEHVQVDHGVRVPSGAGDTPWVGHQNRIYFRVRNVGAAAAHHVQVSVRARPVLTAPDCIPVRQGAVRTTLQSIAPRSDAIGFVPWTPGRPDPAQIRIEVARTAGEPTVPATTRGPRVSVVIAHSAATTTRVEGTLTASGAPGAPTTVLVAGGCGATRLIPVVTNVPPGWKVVVQPPSAPAGAAPQRFRIRVAAPQDAQPGATAHITIGFQAERLADRAGPGEKEVVVPAFQGHGELDLIAGVDLAERVVAH